MNNNKKSVYCTNCNKPNHEYKDCKDPITSWGVILINLSHINTIYKTSTIQHRETVNLKNKVFNIFPQNYKDLENLSMYMNNIRFLMVQRRHSIAFMDFLRARYKSDNVDHINSLFQYMNKSEIQLFKTMNFNELWEEMWNHDVQKINSLKKEFGHAKAHYEKLKNGIDVDLDLNFYINNINPIYKFNEWGFPKGRKDRHESMLDCSLREFSEETGIDITKIRVIKNISPIEENLIGTNGIPYRHIYYVAEIYDSELPNIDNNNEIGQIGYFTYNEAEELIRDYHTEKKKILQHLFMYYLEILTNDNNSD